MKSCCICKEIKSLDSFHKESRRKDGLRLQCKDCLSKYYYAKGKNKINQERTFDNYLKRNYNIDKKDYDFMVNTQNNLCKICGKPETNNTKKKLSVDHCHKSGKVRGLLCHKCNLVLGLIDENPRLLIEIENYLKGE